MKKKKKYVNNHDLLIEVENSKQQDRMTDKLGAMLKRMTVEFCKRKNYAGYTYTEDMQGHALLQLVKYWRCFNAEKSQNPFSYFTQCIDSAFKQYLNHETKHRDIRDELLIDQGLLPSFTYQEKQKSLGVE